METEIFRDLEAVFFKVFNRTIRLSPETTANEVQGWDSLRHVFLISEIEKKFKIKFSFKEISSFNSVADIVRIINSKLPCYWK
jgi:acyl carrier protein